MKRIILSIITIVSLASVSNVASALTESDINMLFKAGIISQSKAEGLYRAFSFTIPTTTIAPTPVSIPISVPTNTTLNENDTSSTVSSCANIQANLFYGSRDASTNGEVTVLQDFLQANSYLATNPSGFFGLMTVAAVKSFQSANGINPTGFVGPLTKAKVNTLSCSGQIAVTPTTTLPVNTVQTIDLKPSASISVFPTSITAGQPVSVKYNSSNINSCIASGGWSGSYYVGAGDKGYFYPTQTTTYTYTCTGTNGTVTANATVNVTPAVTAVVTPSIKVTYPNGGEQLSLGIKDIDFRTEWTSSNLTGNINGYLITAEGFACLVKQNVPVSQGYITATLGSSYQCPGTTKYITPGQYKVLLEVPNSKINSSSGNFFTISIPQAISNVDIKPSATISLSSTSITSGQPLSINYNSSNVTSCVASGGWSGGYAPGAGDKGYFYPTQTTTYTYTCTGQTGTVTANATVNVTPVTAVTNTSTGSNTNTPDGTPTIQITSPNGSETYSVGAVSHITWNSKNVDKVSIGYSFGEGSLNWFDGGAVGYNIPNTGSFDWTVNIGNVASINTQVKIYIIGYHTGVGSAHDSSDNFFTVSQKG